MKYGGTSRLEVGADVAGRAVRCWVRDNGPGIEPSDQARLFTPFSRLHKVRTTGQGLGLSIVRRIVTRLGRQVGVESRPDHGSTFFFTLPAAQTG